MRTYRLPPEPDGPVWVSNPQYGWVKYVKRAHYWYEEALGDQGGSVDWHELLGEGDVVDFDPNVDMDKLTDALIGAALVWDAVPTDDTMHDLQFAIRNYNRGLNSRNLIRNRRGTS